MLTPDAFDKAVARPKTGQVKTSFSYYPQTKEAICGMCCKQFKDLEANVVTEVMENHLLRSCTASGLSCSEQTTLEQ